ncbi:uncharacterized protein [Primulina huaijiensis]|uniref:uncharacterized protein n=1 Tax=Primulina huaijiensis TaxID=1492673 RepID=UPI003CC70BF1
MGQASVQGGRGGYKWKGKEEYRGKAPAVPFESDKPLCPKCHKTHKGECLVGNNKCYRCGGVGHIAINCTQSSGKGRVQGRIFSLTKERINPDSSIISGTILISGKVATTFIDTGATHSFISDQFMHSLGLALIGEIVHFSIVLLSGDYIHSSSVIRACPVQVDEELLNADLIVIPMIESDVILGMDWLSTYRAVIDFVAKTVHFPLGHGDSKVFTGSGTSLGLSFISCLQMQRMLVKGCHGFLASVVDITREGRGNMSDIDIVRDYLDVFVDDVPGLPPDREVEFVIDIVPSTPPISKAPYQMAPTEMKELKSQLQELLDKGFIRPSSSPWGAPVLFVKKKDGSLRLCHIVFKEGIAVDPAKIEAVKKWPIPLTVVEQAFQVLKDKLTSAPVLALPQGAEDFVVYTDASKKGLGVVLMQRGKKELNMRQRRWLALVKDYDCTISYHPGKANVVAYVLSRKSGLQLGSMIPKPLLLDLQKSEIALVEEAKAEKKGNSEFGLNSDGMITFQGRICVPIGDTIRRDVLTEAHTAPYSVHPGGTKMYQDLRRLYLWPGMKKEIASFVSECLTCQQVKIEHQRPAGLLQSLCIPQWKWEHITMDFVVGLPRTQKGERKMLGPELVQQMVDVVAQTRQRMKTAQSRQTSYAHVRRRPLEFNVGDQVFVKIAPLTGVMRFGKKGKLSPRYIGPFEILDRIGERAYRLALPLDLDRVHNVFHVSMLRKYLSNPSHVLRHEALDLLPNLSYEEVPVQILDRKVKVLRNKEIGFVKVLWRNHVIEEATGKPEEEMRERYQDLF